MKQRKTKKGILFALLDIVALGIPLFIFSGN